MCSTPNSITYKTMATGIERYYEAILRVQNQVINSQIDVLQQVAQVMADTIRTHGRLFLFGTGHSHMLAEEAHYRAGGLAAAVPILLPALMLHESAALSTYHEKTAGLAKSLIDTYQPRPGEILFVFSNSGVNTVPVEMAIAGKTLGLTVVALCSMTYSRSAALSSVGKRLFEVADFIIDNGGEPGDALIPLDCTPCRVGPSSTVLGALIWNCLATEAALLLQAQGITPPIYASSNLPNSLEHNAQLLDEWGEGNPHL
jgi:uncharacterized phosphosugar-binding protein